MKKKVVFFDFSGVVASSGYLQWVKEHIVNLESKQIIFNDIFLKLDKGEITRSDLDDFLSKQTGIPVNEILPSVLKKVVVDNNIVSLITNLKETYKVALLTNYSHEVLHEIFTINQLAPLFDEVIISSKHGMIKPDSAFFRKALEIMDITHSEAIFIDDAQKNVDGASKLGIRALLFTSVEKLKLDLTALEVIKNKLLQQQSSYR